MQGQKSTVEVDQGSSSGNSSVDPQVYWSNVLNPMGTRDIADCLLQSDGTVMPFTDSVNPGNGGFNHWNFSNPDSSQSASNQANMEETKRDHEWTPALVSTSGTHPRLHEGRFEAGNMLSLDNLGINITNDQITDGQEYNSLQNTAHTRENSDNGQPSAPCHLINSSRPDSHHVESGIASTNPCSSSAGSRFLPEDADGGPQGSMDGQYGSGKRKMIEGASGQSSTGGIVNHLHHGENSQQTISSGNDSSNNGLNISNSSNNLGISLAQAISPSPGSASRVEVSGSLSSASAERSSENTHRNVRRRANPALEHDLFIPSLWPPGNPARHASMWPPCQPSTVIPYAPIPEVVPSVSTSAPQPYSNVLTIPSLPQNPHPFTWNGTSNSRTDNSSSSPIITGERFPSRRIVRSIPVPTSDVRHLAQDPTNWNLSTGSVSSLGNVASTSRAGHNLASNASVPPTWPPHQLSHIQHTLRSDSSRRSHSSFVSDTGVQSSNIRVQDPSHSTTSQEVILNPGTGVRIQQRHLRSALFVDRHTDGLPSVPLSIRMAALREGGRSRVIAEHIRSALDVLRRGLPYELVRGDILRLESLMFGGLDLHDRHRDMRLDVDNMSYEELLALEERIGNVNTGLAEETVVKHLKQWKYTANSVDTSEAAEPCCICQEEYTEDEDLGTLHCGHSFHCQCIKQWLSYKNLCPVCKTAALNT